MVSVVEAHTLASRGIIPQNRLEDETIVSWNGEDVMHCDPIVKDATRAYISQYKMQTTGKGILSGEMRTLNPI